MPSAALVKLIPTAPETRRLPQAFPNQGKQAHNPELNQFAVYFGVHEALASFGRQPERAAFPQHKRKGYVWVNLDKFCRVVTCKIHILESGLNLRCIKSKAMAVKLDRAVWPALQDEKIV